DIAVVVHVSPRDTAGVGAVVAKLAGGGAVAELRAAVVLAHEIAIVSCEVQICFAVLVEVHILHGAGLVWIGANAAALSPVYETEGALDAGCFQVQRRLGSIGIVAQIVKVLADGPHRVSYVSPAPRRSLARL